FRACDDICVNFYGSYECRCFNGYSLNSNKRSCDDINECTVYGPCDHICRNTPGSYNCQCKTGYTLDSNGKTCS
ncbi:hypothetical protein LOTGIDRAFT_88990, partial [Lottia gigantea]